MNELMHRSVESRKRMEEERRASMEQARRLTPTEVENFESQLRATPDNLDVREKLFFYYGFNQDWRNQNKHVVWAIDHAPSRLSNYVSPDPAVNPAGFEAGKKRWISRLKASSGGEVDKEIYSAAARFIAAGDKQLSESILLDAQKQYSDDRRWSPLLGRLYYEILMGSQGPLPQGVVRSVNLSEAHGSYAQEIRRKLDQTKDVELLFSVGSEL